VSEVVRQVVVASGVGLHARPAGLFVRAVTESGHAVSIAKADGSSADGASILSVIALGVGHGDELTLTVAGDDAETVADSLEALLLTDHDAA